MTMLLLVVVVVVMVVLRVVVVICMVYTELYYCERPPLNRLPRKQPLL
jgi:hypothetical protein